jgi:hypothetical protein
MAVSLGQVRDHRNETVSSVVVPRTICAPQSGIGRRSTGLTPNGNYCCGAAALTRRDAYLENQDRD